MPSIFKSAELEMSPNRSPLPNFSWNASPLLEDIVQSKYLHFDIKSLNPDSFSYPYHFHRNAEELFIVLSGEATLRAPESHRKITRGDLIFFEEGPAGAHQVYNHSDEPFIYVDTRTRANVDVCEYPDSGKINILPAMDIIEKPAKVPYYSGEDQVRDNWPPDLLK